MILSIPSAPAPERYRPQAEARRAPRHAGAVPTAATGRAGVAGGKGAIRQSVLLSGFFGKCSRDPSFAPPDAVFLLDKLPHLSYNIPTALTGNSTLRKARAERRRSVQAFGVAERKAPLSSLAEMRDRQPAVIGKELRRNRLTVPTPDGASQARRPSEA